MNGFGIKELNFDNFYGYCFCEVNFVIYIYNFVVFEVLFFEWSYVRVYDIGVVLNRKVNIFLYVLYVYVSELLGKE